MTRDGEDGLASDGCLRPLGDMLIERGVITHLDLEKAQAFQQQFGGRIGSILVRIGAISEDALLEVQADQLGMRVLSGEELPTRTSDFEAALELGGISPDWLIAREAVVWESTEGVLHAAARNPIDSDLQETFERLFKAQKVFWHFITNQDLDRLLNLLRARPEGFQQDEIAHLRELAEEAPVIELVSNVLAQSVDERASDIHIEPDETHFLIRFRVDGVLRTRYTLPKERFDAVASRVKLISALDIAERRLPQDGRIAVRAGGTEMDIRVSVIPGVHGESIVMRLLPKQRNDLTLDRLGMERDHLELFHRWAKEPHGIVLVTGPTGSGKSTTLYTALQVANDGRHKIITVEDPVEYRMKGITQIQVHNDIGYSFSKALRAILRHDPDIIMIGEIRDLETCEIAVQASLTGHMVFSTLHTNDAIAAFNRLLEMGIEPFLVASSVRAVEAQRLVRRLCSVCSKPQERTTAVLAVEYELNVHLPEFLKGEANWREPVGCPSCKGLGFQGRLGIYEFVEVNEDLQSVIIQRAAQSELVRVARLQGFRTLREDGLLKAFRGETSIEEVLRLTGVGESSL